MAFGTNYGYLVEGTGGVGTRCQRDKGWGTDSGLRVKLSIDLNLDFL